MNYELVYCKHNKVVMVIIYNFATCYILLCITDINDEL